MKSLRLWLLAFAMSSLAGCDKKPSDLEVQTAQKVFVLESRVAALEDQNAARQREIDTLHSILGGVKQRADRSSAQVEQNAANINRNILDEATARGDCGYTRPYQKPDGTWVGSGKVRCTDENYFKR